MKLTENKNLSIFRSAVASTSLVLLANSGPFVAYEVLMRFGPRNLLASFPENPLIWVPLLVLAELGGIVLLLISSGIGGVVWLLLMKLFLTKNEMSIFLGLDVGRSGTAKQVVKWVFDVVY